ncbi:MAG: DUF6356 family protein [Pseudomonadota bacterium]
MTSLFTSHPASVGESYFAHFLTAMKFSVTMVFGCVVCAIHAVLPFLFEKTGSRIIEHLHHTMVTHRNRSIAAPDHPAPSDQGTSLSQ